MDINEVMKRQQSLNESIRDLVTTFEKDTGLQVEGVDLDWQACFGGGGGPSLCKNRREAARMSPVHLQMVRAARVRAESTTLPEPECLYCGEHPERPACLARIHGTTGSSLPFYYCTRPAGHDGPCVVCTTVEHDLTNAIGANRG